MLDDTHIYVSTAPWFVVFPGIAVVLTVLCLNRVGDAVRDLADPYAASRRGRASGDVPVADGRRGG